jgi:heterodisulfide reductase subunit C
MVIELPARESQVEFLRQVRERGAEDPALCYQCGKCTAGCPIAYAMDYPPHQIMRGVQLGMRDVVLSSRTIWLCAACETCSTRCPQSVDPAGVMDALRRIAYAEGIRSPERDVPLFHGIFLGSVRQFGRIFEAAMIGFYNLLSGHYTKDVVMAPKMLLKGKLSLLPPRVKNGKELRRIFAKTRELEGKLE